MEIKQTAPWGRERNDMDNKASNTKPNHSAEFVKRHLIEFKNLERKYESTISLIKDTKPPIIDISAVLLLTLGGIVTLMIMIVLIDSIVFGIIALAATLVLVAVAFNTYRKMVEKRYAAISKQIFFSYILPAEISKTLQQDAKDALVSALIISRNENSELRDACRDLISTYDSILETIYSDPTLNKICEFTKND